jgi:hypothetical protein
MRVVDAAHDARITRQRTAFYVSRPVLTTSGPSSTTNHTGAAA